jgi:hypothetical protein
MTSLLGFGGDGKTYSEVRNRATNGAVFSNINCFPWLYVKWTLKFVLLLLVIQSVLGIIHTSHVMKNMAGYAQGC